MRTMGRWILTSLVIGGLIGGTEHVSQAAAKLTPYFQYTEEAIASLRGLPVQSEMSFQELAKWDDRMFELMSKHELGADLAAKLLAYLTVAQRDAAALALQTHGKLAGRLGPVSSMVLCEFFPDECPALSKRVEADPYSQAVVEVLRRKIRARLHEDRQRTKPVELKRDASSWTGAEPYGGIECPTWKPWVIQSASQFRAPAPPPLDYSSPVWQQQLQAVTQALSTITDERRAKGILYAAGPGTRTWIGVWVDEAGKLFEQSQTPLPQALFIRSLLGMALADAVITVFDTKYTYCTKRPNQLDPSLVTIMPTPNFPAYTAGHSCLSGAASAVLARFFPHERDRLFALNKEIEDSRVWIGVHFPIDGEVGTPQGRRVGEWVVTQQSEAR